MGRALGVDRRPGITNLSTPPGEAYNADRRQHLWRLHYRVTAPDGAVFEDAEEVWLGQTLRPVPGVPINVTYRTKDNSLVRFDDTLDNLHALRLAIQAATPPTDAAGTAGPGTDTGGTAEERLKTLDRLKSEGILSEGEYATQRQRILDSL